MKINWNFLGGGGGGVQNKKTLCGGSMDIFLNCTICSLFLQLIVHGYRFIYPYPERQRGKKFLV